MAATQNNVFNSYKVYNGYGPASEPRTLPLLFTFSAAITSIAGDLVSQMQNGQLEFVQSVYIDNTNNGASVSLSFGGSNQSLDMPAYCQGYLPVLVPSPRYVLSTTGGGQVQVQFLTFAMPAFVWAANGLPVVNYGGAPIDHSNAQPTLAANLLATAPANAARANIEYQNQSANQHQLVLDDGAGNGLTVLLMAAGAGANKQGSSWSDPYFKGRLRVFSAVANDQLSLRES